MTVVGVSRTLVFFGAGGGGIRSSSLVESRRFTFGACVIRVWEAASAIRRVGVCVPLVEMIGRGGWFRRSTRGIITRRSCCWVSIQVVLDAISIHGSGVDVGGANIGRGSGKGRLSSHCRSTNPGVARDSLLFPRAAARGPL